MQVMSGIRDIDTYLVNEIFDSIEGEGKRAGLPATFIRLSGCNLRCKYCDTAYAFEQGTQMTPEEIVEKVKFQRVTLTGGEPLCQKVQPLLQALADHEVNIETNGSLNIQPYQQLPNVFLTVDYKCGAAGTTSKMFLPNFKHLRPCDVLKFVVGSVADLQQAQALYTTYKDFLKEVPVYVSPVFGSIEPVTIVEYIKTHKLENWRVQLQLHKYIWDPAAKGV